MLFRMLPKFERVVLIGIPVRVIFGGVFMVEPEGVEAGSFAETPVDALAAPAAAAFTIMFLLAGEEALVFSGTAFDP